MTLRCAECGGPVEVASVSASDTAASERYECIECGNEGTYVNEFGVPGSTVRKQGLIDR